MRNQIRFLAAAAVALGLTGCGDTSQGDGAVALSETKVAKGVFVAKADAVCRASDVRLASELARVRASPGQSTSIAAAAPSLDVHAKTIRSQITEISALGRPSKDVSALNGYLNQRTTDANALQAAAAAARKADARDFEAILAAIDINRAATLARSFGFQVCASSKVQ